MKKIKNLELRIKNLPSAEIQKKLKIEARSQTMMRLHNHCSLSVGEVPAERSEDEN